MTNDSSAALFLRMARIAMLALLVAALPGLVSAQAPQLVVDDPNDSTLNLRAGPGTGHPVILRMPNGTVATLLDQQGDWARIRHESGQEGWAYYHYLIDERPGQPAAMIVQNPRRDDLNTRAGPGTNYRVLSSLRNGTAVLVFARRGDWVWLRMSDGRSLGWAYEPFLIPAPERAPMPPAAPPAVAAPQPPAAAPPASPPPVLQPPQQRVILSAREPYAVLYAGPDDATARLSRWANGTRVTELAEFEGWAEVITPDGARGWMEGLWLVTPEEWARDQGRPAPAEAGPTITPSAPSSAVLPPLILEGSQEIRTRGMGAGTVLSHISTCPVMLVLDRDDLPRLAFEPCEMEFVDLTEAGDLAVRSYSQPLRVHEGTEPLDRTAPDFVDQLAAWLRTYFETHPNARSVMVQPVGEGVFIRLDMEEIPYAGFVFHEENILQLAPMGAP